MAAFTFILIIESASTSIILLTIFILFFCLLVIDRIYLIIFIQLRSWILDLVGIVLSHSLLLLNFNICFLIVILGLELLYLRHHSLIMCLFSCYAQIDRQFINILSFCFTFYFVTLFQNAIGILGKVSGVFLGSSLAIRTWRVITCCSASRWVFALFTWGDATTKD